MNYIYQILLLIAILGGGYFVFINDNYEIPLLKSDENNITKENTKNNEDSPYKIEDGKVFYLEDEMAEADPETFYVLRGLYSQDKNGIYYGNIKLPIDENTYELIDDKFIKDENSIFLEGINIMDFTGQIGGKENYKNIDVKTFQKVELPKSLGYHAFYKDKNHYYSIGDYTGTLSVSEMENDTEVEKCLEDYKFCR